MGITCAWVPSAPCATDRRVCPTSLRLHHESHDGAAQVDFVSGLQPGAPRIAMYLEAHPVAHDARPSIPRHREVNDFLARKICADLQIPRA
jgi:hypothetical protein